MRRTTSCNPYRQSACEWHIRPHQINVLFYGFSRKKIGASKRKTFKQYFFLFQRHKKASEKRFLKNIIKKMQSWRQAKGWKYVLPSNIYFKTHFTPKCKLCLYVTILCSCIKQSTVSSILHLHTMFVKYSYIYHYDSYLWSEILCVQALRCSQGF